MSFSRDRRIKSYTLVPMIIVGILAGAAGGLAFALGAFGTIQGGPRNPGGIIFFVLPPLVCWAIGSIAYRIALRFAPMRDGDEM